MSTGEPWNYLRDAPYILNDGTVQRFPWVFFKTGETSLRYVIRLYKRRRRCNLCGHRHGPTRNLQAKPCEAGSRSCGCGCEHMIDWGHPREMISR